VPLQTLVSAHPSPCPYCQEQPASDAASGGAAASAGSGGSKQQPDGAALGAAALARLTPTALPDDVQALLRQSVAFMQAQSSLGSEALVRLGCAGGSTACGLAAQGVAPHAAWLW
jgi:hypothetical protein